MEMASLKKSQITPPQCVKLLTPRGAQNVCTFRTINIDTNRRSSILLDLSLCIFPMSEIQSSNMLSIGETELYNLIIFSIPNDRKRLFQKGLCCIVCR